MEEAFIPCTPDHCIVTDSGSSASGQTQQPCTRGTHRTDLNHLVMPAYANCLESARLIVRVSEKGSLQILYYNNNSLRPETVPKPSLLIPLTVLFPEIKNWETRTPNIHTHIPTEKCSQTFGNTPARHATNQHPKGNHPVHSWITKCSYAAHMCFA